MGIFSEIIEFLFDRKKKQNDEIRAAMERINPVKFFQTLADYANSLGFATAEGMSAYGVSSDPNYAINGIQFRMFGQVVAVGLNSYLQDKFTPGIYYTSGPKEGGFTGPFTITTLNMIKADLEMVAIRQKEIHQQLKLASINEDFV